MSIIEERLPYIEKIQLGHGSHEPPNNGLVNACVMEAVAYVTGEPWSDHPECVSPVIGAFLRSWNDSLDDEGRQMLKPYILRVVGTNTGRRDDEKRAWLATDWLARECAPAWLRLAGLTAQAEALERLAPLTSAAKARKAQPKLDAALKDSAAARDAAWAAACASGAAAWAAPAAWAAAGAPADAARDAAWDAADAAWAAGAAARDAARAAAAAWAAARDAAWDAADAAWAAAWDAARDAARAALAPTTRGLQASALLLLDRMIEVGR